MTLRSISTNGVPVEDYGLIPIGYDQWLSRPAVQYGNAAISGLMGALASTRGIQYAARKIGLGVLTENATKEGGRLDLAAFYLATQGEIELESIDCPGRVCYGYFEAGVGDSGGVKLLSPEMTSIGTITCYNPFWYDRGWLPFGSQTAGARIPIPVGGAPSRIRLAIPGPYINPIFTLRDRTGFAIATMPFTDTAADTTIYLELDFPGQNVNRYVNGVCASINNGYGLLDRDSTFFVADPLDAPTLEANVSWSGLAQKAHLV